MFVGIVGLKGSGKDTVANFFVKDFNFNKDSFAKPLKDMVCALFNWPRHMIEGDTQASREWRETKDEYWSTALGRDITPRNMMTTFGTDLINTHFDSRVWIQSLLQRNSLNDVVISDVRFVHEMRAIKDSGGLLIRVKRGKDPEYLDEVRLGYDWAQFYSPCGNYYKNVHRSEWDWAKGESLIDATIENNGTLDDLYTHYKNVIEDHLVLS